MSKLLKENFFLILIPIAVLFTFWNLPNTFYQQDEWQTLGHNLAQGLNFTNNNPLSLLFDELRPLSSILYFVFLGVFKFTVVPAVIFAMTLQILNSLLLYYFAQKISGSKFVAISASLFLIVNNVSQQAVTWVSAVTTLPAATLILLSLIYYLEYLNTNKNKYKIISFISAIVSLYFKGVGLFLFILLPLMYFLFKKEKVNKENLKRIIRINLPLLAFGVITFLYRLGSMIFNTHNIVGYVGTGSKIGFLQTNLFHLFLYPLTSLFQVFIPPLDFYPPMSDIAKFQYHFLVGSPLVDLVAQSAVSDMVALLGSILILFSFIFILLWIKDKNVNRNILFALLFFFLSFLPYVSIYRDSSYLSSRYFYVGAAAAGILFGYFIYFIMRVNKLVKWLTIFLVFLFLFHHASVVKNDISYQVNLGNQRKAVLEGIRHLYPKLEKDSIFYVTSDKQYYGNITNPFQNGLGYVLEVWYYDSENVPKKFLSDNFLWDLGAEGYKKEGGYSFGYYQDIDKMISDMEANKLKTDVVHAFFIRSSDTKVLDITSETRDKISTFSALAK